MSRKVIGGLVLSVLAIAVIITIAFAASPKHTAGSRPEHARLPKVSGSPILGHTLHASRGRWSGASKFVYHWKRCNTHGAKCQLIHRPKSGRRQPASQYTLTGADVGHRIRVTVIASNRRGSTSATSAAAAAVRRAATPGGGAQGAAKGLHVVGNTLENRGGQKVVLHGTDISGSTYACEQNGGYGFSDTPSGDSLYAPMAAWHINSVTLGINQDCWLGINGVKAQYSGRNYINWVKAQVKSMEKHGIYPVLGFFVGEPGSTTPNWYSLGNGNAPMPDNDHAPLVWQEIANTFKNDPNVIFRLYEEPYPESTTTSLGAWKCWSQGDVQYSTSSVRSLADAARVSLVSPALQPLEQGFPGHQLPRGRHAVIGEHNPGHRRDQRDPDPRGCLREHAVVHTDSVAGCVRVPRFGRWGAGDRPGFGNRAAVDGRHRQLPRYRAGLREHRVRERQLCPRCREDAN